MALFAGIELPGAVDLENVRRLDLLPLPMIRKIHRYGIAIDPEYFQELSSEFAAEMVELERDIAAYIPPDALHEFAQRSADYEAEFGDASINAASSEQVGKLLFDILGVGAGQKLKKTKGGERLSTGKAQLQTLNHPLARKILAFRERHKLKTTYADSLPQIAKFHNHGGCEVCGLWHKVPSWRAHTEIVTTRTTTGRLASRNKNLQNIPQRTKLGERIRAGFIAPEGMKLVSVDFSQIELRVMAHIANCQSMIQVYLDDGDIHERTAMECFGLDDPAKIDKVRHRIPSKTVNFLSQYGGQKKTLYAQLFLAFSILITEGKLDELPEWLDVEWCGEFIDRWFAQRPEVREFLDQEAYRARRYGKVWDLFGRPRLIPEMKSTHSWIREAGMRQAGNVKDQGTAAGLMKLAMGSLDPMLDEVRAGGVWAWPLLTIHDQLIIEADEADAEMVGEIVMSEFDAVMHDWDTGEDLCRVPIKSDCDILDKWMKEQ